MLAASVPLIAALVVRERRVRRPMLDMSLFTHRGFLLNTVAATLVNFVLPPSSRPSSATTPSAPASACCR